MSTVREEVGLVDQISNLKNKFDLPQVTQQCAGELRLVPRASHLPSFVLKLKNLPFGKSSQYSNKHR